MIPISVVQVGGEEEDLVLEVLRSGNLGQGPKVAELEQIFSEWIGVEHVVAVNNGTTALIAALQALEIGAGDEVITSPFTFVATLNAILDTGATVRFADIALDDFLLDPAMLFDVMGERTRAVLPVHLYGQAADVPRILEIIGSRDIALVEDAAQAHGARIGGRAVGSFGVGCFSLYATKNFTTGEGGLITTSDAALADRLRLLRNQGMRKRYEYEIPGYNYRMTDVQAAIGIPQLQRAEAVTAARQRNAAWLTDALDGILGLVTPQAHAGRNHVFHQYTVRITQDAPVTRDEFIERLGELGVGCGIYYPRAVYDYACYRDHPRVVADHTPNAEQAAREVVSIPVHPALTESDRARVAECVRKAVGA
ncbi:MAG: DegT/DnrJ/EryC1/StrS family aminotransferase [Acidimicrobiia bacterium]